jgi:hypothetical protein
MAKKEKKEGKSPRLLQRKCIAEDHFFHFLSLNFQNVKEQNHPRSFYCAGLKKSWTNFSYNIFIAGINFS